MNVLDIKNLKIIFRTGEGFVRAVEGVDISIGEGERVAIVGESGCGKSVTGLSCMSLLTTPPAYVSADEFTFTSRDGVKHDIREKTENEMLRLRAEEMAMIFQDPSTFLNPVMTIGEQLDEVFIYHMNMKPKEARARSIEMMKKVGIPDPEMRAQQYPHELSGGLKQRILIAMATSLSPRLLIADEPTTALDVTIQAQILNLISEHCEKEKMSLLMITHDLGVVREMADRVYVMYCGKIVEEGTVEEIIRNPRHPYTKALIDTVPGMDEKVERFVQIPHNVPHPMNKPQGCYFSNRCAYCTELCKKQQPPLYDLGGGRKSRCYYRPEELWEK
ncbi:MAG: ABC transporter ATP-binding protein [Ruminococcaceae bacterium]|nr:ABC transporter ATP-binding protein [Oscillospiraceae bacterium]